MDDNQFENEDDVEVVDQQEIGEMVAALAAQGKFEPGFHDDIPNELYHAGPGVSSTTLKAMAVSPLHWKTERDHPRPSSPAKFFGAALHTLVLEPDVFKREYVMLPLDAPARPSQRSIDAKKPGPSTLAAIAWWEAFDAMYDGMKVITNKPGKDPFWSPGDWDKLHYMRDALYRHPYASIFLDRFIPERTMIWRKPVEIKLPTGDLITVNELCKCRFDGIDVANNVGFDLKSTREAGFIDASYSGFTRAIVEHGYAISREWYMEGQAETGHNLQEFVFIAQEKEPPWAVGVYTLDQRFRDQARTLARVYLERYTTCRETNEWPCYPPQPRELQMPKYAEMVRIA